MAPAKWTWREDTLAQGLNAMAAGDPARAVARVRESGAPEWALRYVAEMVRRLGRRMDRFTTPAMIAAAKRAAGF